MPARLNQRREIGDVLGSRQTPRQDLADVAIAGELLQPFGVLNRHRGRLAQEEVPIAAQDLEQLGVHAVIGRERLKPGEQRVVVKAPP